MMASSMPSHPDGLIDGQDKLANFDIYARDEHDHVT